MQQEESLISVIVPIYSIDQYIGICIESLLNQTYKNLEIILVDDGSPDRCPEICDLYASKDKRIKVIHKENGGLVSARKSGLAIYRGQYIGYVDGDDWVDPDFYESVYNAITESQSDVVCAGFSRDLFTKSVHFKNHYRLGIYEGKELVELQNNMISYGDFYRPGITTYVWNKLFKKEILYHHQMSVDEKISIGEDAAVVYPVLMECNRVCLTDCVSYHYRQREDSMLKKNASFEKEVIKLKYLSRYMETFTQIYGRRFQKQVRDYILGICIMRSGGKLPDDSFSTFDERYYDSNIVIYSAGTFGQQLMNRLKESQNCKVVGWIDEDYWEYRRCCLNVDPVEDILKRDFDYILIATIDCRVAESIRDKLISYGVLEQKILTVDCCKSDRDDLLKKYLE